MAASEDPDAKLHPPAQPFIPLVSTMADDEDMIEVIEPFVAGLPDRVRALKDAFSGNDLKELARLAHQLKGTAGSHGFPSITSAAALLESSVVGNNANLISPTLELLSRLCARASAH